MSQLMPGHSRSSQVGPDRPISPNVTLGHSLSSHVVPGCPGSSLVIPWLQSIIPKPSHGIPVCISNSNKNADMCIHVGGHFVPELLTTFMELTDEGLTALDTKAKTFRDLMPFADAIRVAVAQQRGFVNTFVLAASMLSEVLPAAKALALFKQNPIPAISMQTLLSDEDLLPTCHNNLKDIVAIPLEHLTRMTEALASLELLRGDATFKKFLEIVADWPGGLSEQGLSDDAEGAPKFWLSYDSLTLVCQQMDKQVCPTYY